MIYLEPKIFDSASKYHFSQLEKLIIRRINAPRIKLPGYLKKYLKDNLENILRGKPEKLIKINTAFYNTIRSTKAKKKSDANKHLKKIFNYDAFIDKKETSYDAYDLAEKLDVMTCPYCNRNSIITVLKGKRDNQKITRPQFDHYFAKSIYPLLALSFYNLIPSCSTCNTTLKGSVEFDLKKHIHPYMDNCYDLFKFSFNPINTASLKGAKNKHHVKISFDSAKDPALAKKIENTLEIFKIKEIYNGHGEEISELLRIKEVMSDKYLQILAKNTYKKLKVKEDELYRLAFGTYRDEASFSKRPFSKLKKDILKEIGII